MDAELQNRLSDYINALRPIIYINNCDYDRVDSLIENAANVSNKDSKRFTFTNSGIFAGKERQANEDDSLESFLEDKLVFLDGATEYNPMHVFIILKDAQQYFDAKSTFYSPKCVSFLKEIALRTLSDDSVYVTVFMVSPVPMFPREIEKLITVFDIPYPTTDEIPAIIRECSDDEKNTPDDEVLGELAVALKGLSEIEIRQILYYAFQQKGTLSKESIKLILKEKEQIIKKSGSIEIFTANVAGDDIGGLENLKSYLEKKAKIFSHLDEAREFGVDIPKGILIVGMPGCGKSLTAKATASMFNVPLLHLDIGKLMGKYVGESEHNLSAAIKTAEAVAPCVLWIDEVEKMFAGVGGLGGASDVTTRLFGQFLTWMQEKESPVYIVATANNVSAIPPEFFRKGRFDETFVVDFPSEEESKHIFEIHLRKRGQLSKEVDISELAKETEGFCGADIESVVKEAVEAAFCEENKDARCVTTEKLLEIINKAKSRSNKEEKKEQRSTSENLSNMINTLESYNCKFLYASPA